MKLTKSQLKQLIKEELEETKLVRLVKKVGPAFGGEKTLSADEPGDVSAMGAEAIKIAKKVQTELIEIVRSPDDEGNTPAGKAKEALKTSDLAEELRRAADLVDIVVAYVQKGV
tara:strand:+ start:415 stop:756 length:342 start_codon:yes stop_codon:yes gene_type:complete